MQRGYRLAGFLPLTLMLAAATPEPGPGHAFVSRGRWTDELGQSHERFIHAYLGLRVWGSEMVQHTGPGAQAPTQRLAVARGPLKAPMALSALPPGMVGEPVLWPETVDIPAGPTENAVFVHRQVVGYREAYYVKAQVDPQTPLAQAWDVVLDAGTGEVLEQIPRQALEVPAKGTGHSLWSGQVILDTTDTGDGFLLKDLTRGKGGRFGANAILDGGYAASDGPIVASATNTWGNGQAEPDGVDTTSPTGQTVAADMAYGLQTTWDYYLTIHNRLGVDGAGTSITGVAHGDPLNLADNAGWYSGRRTFAVGKPDQFSIQSDLEALGHEIAHGVTEFSANLRLEGESGGLNEGMSDIFGKMVSAWRMNGGGAGIGDPGISWKVSLFSRARDASWAVRDFIKPSNAHDSAPDTWEPGLAAMEIHRASGPLLRAFYFLSQGGSADSASEAYSPDLPEGMAGIGNDQAAAIMYRALNTYLMPTSDYSDARDAALTSAIDLYGAGSPQVRAVAKAFAAIRVGFADMPGLPADGGLPLTAVLDANNLTLTATPAAQANRVLFFVDDVFAGRADAHPFTLTLNAWERLSRGDHAVTAKAYDARGLAGQAAPVAVTWNGAVQQVLANGGLEAGRRGWRIFRNNLLAYDPTGASPHGGVRWLKFDNPGVGGVLWAETPVAIPADATWAEASFWVRVESDAPLPEAEGLDVEAVTAEGFRAAVRVDADRHLGVWRRYALDLSSQAGRTVTLEFNPRLDPRTTTAFHVDDVAVVCSSGHLADVRVTPAAVEAWAGSPDPVAFAATLDGVPDPDGAWTAVGGGSFDAPGAYVPPLAPGVYKVVFTPAMAPGRACEVPVRVKPPLLLGPQATTLDAGATRSFHLETKPGLTPLISLEGGPDPGRAELAADRSAIVYTAPFQAGTYTLVARDPDSGHTARVAVTVRAEPLRVSIEPPSVHLAIGARTQFSARVRPEGVGGVTWSLLEGNAGGFVGPSGAYAAPMTAGTYHLVATSAADPTRSAVATLHVEGAVALDPAGAALLTGDVLQFRATVPGYGSQAVAWSLGGGAGTGTLAAGRYTAPATPGTYTVTATSVAQPGLADTATVRVRTTDLNANGRTFFDEEDMALMADAWQTREDAEDFNGDGIVDDLDLDRFLVRYRIP